MRNKSENCEVMKIIKWKYLFSKVRERLCTLKDVGESPQTESNGTRRTFLKSLAIFTAGTTALLTFPGRLVRRLYAEDSDHQQTSKSGNIHKWGMVIDLDKCSGCGACMVACRAENNIPAAGPEHTKKGRSISWMALLKKVEGKYPDIRTQILPQPCNHCEDPPCTKVCPTGATTRGSDGIVHQIPARCIGCRLCMVSCPYSRRYFNWSEPEWPDELKNQLNPDVSTRTLGVVEKCTFCHHRIRKVRYQARAEGRGLRDEELVRLPACAQICPAGAITFGDFNDDKSTVSILKRHLQAFVLLPELGTRPKVTYLSRGIWKT